MRCGFTEEDTAESLHRSGCLAALWGLALWYNKCLYSFNSFSAEDTLLTGRNSKIEILVISIQTVSLLTDGIKMLTYMDIIKVTIEFDLTVLIL